MTAATIWAFAGQPEYAACESRLFMLNGDPNRSVRCDVLHDETGELMHSGLVNGHRVFWTTLEGEISETWLGILPTCAHCGARYRKADSGCGEFCGARCELADKQISRDYQLDEVA